MAKMGAKPKNEREEVERLVDELFRRIEGAQGYFHVSDGETFATKKEFFGRIRGRLEHGRKATRIMAAFLRKHNEL